MTTLPAASDFTSSTVVEASFKTAITNLRAYLSGLLGDDGTVATALDTLGGLGSATASKTAAYTVLATDKGVVLLCNGTFTLTLTAAATLGSKFAFAVINTGTGTITIDPNASELIDGAATKTLVAGQGVVVVCDGTGFYTIGGGGGSAGLGSGTLTKTAAYTVASADLGKTVLCSGTWTLTLPAAATAGDGKMLGVVNTSTGVITIDPDATELIDGSATMAVAAYESLFIVCDAVGWKALGRQVAKATRADTATSVANASISQAKLKTTTGAVSTASAAAYLTLPGGSYGFWPQVKGGVVIDSFFVAAPMSREDALGGAKQLALGTSYNNYILLGSASGDTLYAQQQYIQASPPYNLGDGDVPLFSFALLEKGRGKILAMYTAPEAPWHNNGPTSIRPDHYDLKTGKKYKRVRCAHPGKRFDEVEHAFDLVEIDQAMKQADMPLIPHPFGSFDPAKHVVVLLDPVATLNWRAFEAFEHDWSELQQLLYDDHLRIDNTPLNRQGPPGVLVCAAKWRQGK